MDSLIKLLTTIGIIAALGFVGKEYYELLTDLKSQKELITTQADDVGEVVAIWVEKSASMEDLKNYSAQLVTKKAVIDAEEERKISEERAKITFTDEINHDGDPGGTYMASEEDESSIIFEPYNLENSVAVFLDGPKSAHGVRLITKDVERRALYFSFEGFSKENGWTGDNP